VKHGEAAVQRIAGYFVKARCQAIQSAKLTNVNAVTLKCRSIAGCFAEKQNITQRESMKQTSQTRQKAA